MRAIVLGGTGAIGGAAASRLAAAGWRVEVTGREPSAMPPELIAADVRFHAVDRGDTTAIERLIGDGAELLVDLLAYRGADVRALLPAMASITCPILVSSRAVYVDAAGRHINSDEPPRFDIPLAEDAPTLTPASDEVDPFTREGYGPSKVAAEQTALESGLPFTVIRPSKVHGRWARQPRTRSFVERMLAGEPTIALADRGESIDHLTAASNTAALIQTVAAVPGQRILNSADPDAPTAELIVRAIAERLQWEGTLQLLDHDDPKAERGRHPWQATHPIELDTSASESLGYAPAGDALSLLVEEIDWLAERVR